MRRVVDFIKVTVEECNKDNTPLIAAGLAFYALLSLAPALWILVGVAGMVYGADQARAELLASIGSFTDPKIAQMVGDALNQVSAGSSYATVLGIASVLFGATFAFTALQDSLNTIWDVSYTDRGYVKDIEGYVTKRVLSLGLVLLAGLYLFISLLANTALAAAAKFAPWYLPAPGIVIQAVGFVISLVLITALFAVVFRTLPDRDIRWRDVWIGAAVTALLFNLGKTLIALYLAHSSLTSAYGAAGSVVLFLLWIYYSAQVFLFGAEFTEVYARQDPGCQRHYSGG
jgi:membrane protein